MPVGSISGYSEVSDRVVRQRTVSGPQHSVGAVLRVVRQLPHQVGSHGPTEVDGAGVLEYLLPLLEADGDTRVDDLVRPLPVDSEDPDHGHQSDVGPVVLAEGLGEQLGADAGPAAGPVGVRHVEHHQLQERVARREGEGVVGDSEAPGPGLDCHVLVVRHVIEDDVVRVQVEAAIPPDQEHPEGVRQVDHRVVTSLVDGGPEK